MAMENSREIERMLKNEIRDQKRTGRGAFHRTGKGSDRARVAGGVRFPKNNFKKYEKNSKVKSNNLHENVISYEKLTTFSEDQQRDLLAEWMLRYTNVYIYSEMGIAENKFYHIVKELNVERKGEPMRVNEDVLSRYKEGNIQPHEFKSLPDDQKHELVEHLKQSKGYTNKEMAAITGYNQNTFNTRKSIWKRASKELHKQKGEYNMSNYDDNFLIDVDENENKNKATEIREKQPKENIGNVKNKIEDTQPIQNKQKTNKKGYSFSINFNESLSGSQIKDKFDALGMLLNKDKTYKVSFTIEEE